MTRILTPDLETPMEPIYTIRVNGANYVKHYMLHCAVSSNGSHNYAVVMSNEATAMIKLGSAFVKT